MADRLQRRRRRRKRARELAIVAEAEINAKLWRLAHDLICGWSK